LGVEAERELANGARLRLSLCFNPSHLEFVGPVVLGRSRARQDRLADDAATSARVLPLIVHGDAAFAGQGIVQEQLNLSRLAGYTTGGALHLVLNNQIGFTTEPEQGRSTQYATDVARMLQIPIFHVNGEDPEAVDRVVRLAIDFRTTWHRDVVIDMYCFRRRGHMELDDPSLTQPMLHRSIAERPPIHRTYTQNLLRLGQLGPDEAEGIALSSRKSLEAELARAERAEPGPAKERGPFALPDPGPATETSVPGPRLTSLLQALCALPPGFHPHPKIEAMSKRRRAMCAGRQRLDWATGEALAYATLLAAGHRVRLTGQDSERGTFAHRHAVLHDLDTGAKHVPLAEIAAAGGGAFAIHNSPLTESAVLGFELGYSIERLADLVIWEAQFGDFANVAQVVIDQFLVSSEAKWRQPSGLVLFLPHGLEGQGPEHSSARPERFLQLCARQNISLAYLTTAAQVFHRLRQQALSARRQPLIVFTPKRMLQHASATSSLDDLAGGRFRAVIVDRAADDADCILLCAGQIAAELTRERKQRRAVSTICRLEQLYPFPNERLEAIVAEYPRGVPIIWVQEEPENMGPGRWIRPRLESLFPDHPIRGVARPERESPATGSATIHQREQRALLDAAFIRPRSASAMIHGPSER
jgi:2-oxoglutarate dehydrogenase E1 component